MDYQDKVNQKKVWKRSLSAGEIPGMEAWEERKPFWICRNSARGGSAPANKRVGQLT